MTIQQTLKELLQVQREQIENTMLFTTVDCDIEVVSKG